MKNGLHLWRKSEVGVFAGPADWWTDGTDDGRTHIATKGIVQDGLVLNLDAGASSSYPGSGTTWSDLSGNGNNGTLDNSVTFTSNNGGGFSFDGTDEIISLPKIITTNDFTICQFISYTSDTGEGWTFEQYNYGAGRLILNTVLIGGSNKFRFFIGGNAFFSSTNLVSGQKYFICCSRSGSSGSIYINGNLDATGTLNSNSIDNITSAIGGSRAFSSAKQFIGDIYTTSVYNKALTASEIQQNFNATRGRFGL